MFENMFLEEKKVSAKCHRNKHEDSTNGCKNKQKRCGCMCHRVKQLNEEKTKSDLEILDDFICMKFRRFVGVRV